MGSKQVDQIPMESYFSDMKTLCKDSEFYFKLLHGIIVTKKELFLYVVARIPLSVFGTKKHMLLLVLQLFGAQSQTYNLCYDLVSRDAFSTPWAVKYSEKVMQRIIFEYCTLLLRYLTDMVSMYRTY